MFIGIRDILFARGRFTLISAVIALMSFMVVALSALTNGLQGQSISAVERLPGQSVVLQAPAQGQSPSLSESTLDAHAVSQVREAADAQTARLGVATTRLGHGGSSAALSVFGADPALMPRADEGTQPGDGEILLSHSQADDLGVTVGDTVTAGADTLRVSGLGDAGSFAHTPVGYTTVSTWESLSHDQGTSAVVVFGQAPTIDGTTVLPMSSITDAVPGYGSEHGSLLAMQLMLLAISALVVGAFFTVWTQQRRGDLAVVRAMGADRSYLLRDGLGQAVVVLVAGQAVGVTAGVLLALAASGTVPIVVTAVGVLVPVLGMTGLGLLGALLAVLSVTKVDPLVAMQR
ncbi:FtsX-like permease family protein [Tomitella fengzijianii]|uniref:FtsX-like permease family protein n=1 Tax=Tomitella fengzijianii TaxID=2597660 RepID=A0A516X4V8_9ACTN|nr:FtsX-like permease family protein [Tomitella fengzijianii]QDQ98097.1 FtsX-like permease family protein [Tomitella fengzijianii]